MNKRIPLKLLRLHSCPIWEQLALEEALFRIDCTNWCILNDSSPPAIVIGLSQQPNELIYLEEAKRQKIPLIRRFSGGGTVVIDEETLFCSFLFNNHEATTELHPNGILNWSYQLLKPAFHPHPFALQENDFALLEKKIGGNAQALNRTRFLNHTSFLWSWDKKRMNTLKHPQKQPLWRQQRPHEDFIGKLKDSFPSKEELISRIIKTLSLSFDIEIAFPNEAQRIQKLPHRKALQLLF